jgi:hypothetical protein
MGSTCRVVFVYPGALFSDVYELNRYAMGGDKAAVEMVLTPYTPISAAKAYLIQIAAAAGCENHLAQFGLGGFVCNLLRPFCATCLCYLLDAVYVRKQFYFPENLFEIYHGANAAAAAT